MELVGIFAQGGRRLNRNNIFIILGIVIPTDLLQYHPNPPKV